jgi:hypothetical protein
MKTKLVIKHKDRGRNKVYKVYNENGEPELGTYYIAEFEYKKDAEFYIKAVKLAESLEV